MIVVVVDADVFVVAARVAVGDEAIHDGRDHRADQETRNHLGQERAVQARRTPNAFQGLGQKAHGGGGQHEPRAQPQNAVVGPAREPAEEEERKSPQARGQAGQASGEEGLQHGEAILTTQRAQVRISSMLRQRCLST